MSNLAPGARPARPILANLLAELELEASRTAEPTRRPRVVTARAVRRRQLAPRDARLASRTL